MRLSRHIGAHIAAALVAALTLPLAGCGTPGPQEAPTAAIGTAPARNDLAYVVISAGQQLKGRRGPTRIAIATRWSLVPQPAQLDATTVVLTADDETRPYVTRVRAGRYELQSFAFGLGGQLYSSSGGMSLAQFSAEPGEVVYVGHLLVKTRDGLLGTLGNDFGLAVESHEQEARAHLKQQDAALAARLQTRLMTLSPMLQRLSQAP